ncbi:MAG: alpha/beta fold hydrolase [Kordiimonadaceae bacterium]|nr:alpha/beta fold hydrolase [Kordiimonadaceae bacterium]MBO6569938.1 alpha/beta fold hydrolase [Kordiimonadaceae bacterium]MBO6965965.1 alpha/beta fold hydrolase [Kordiimonadaceae bacterium]
MKNILKLTAGMALAAALTLPVIAQGTSGFWADPASIDADYLPAMAELNFMSFGAKLNGHIYLANGAGPHPTVVLLHGFPGNEKNLDLAQALRRGGFNVLFFHYRGAWGSEGIFSFGNVVDDVASALTFLRSPEVAAEYRVDQARLSLIGHSMGGFAALMAGAKDPAVACVGALAPANLGNRPAASMTEEALAGFAAYTDSLTMLNTESGQAVVDEMLDRNKEFDTRALAPKFSERPVMLLAGAQDAVLPPEIYHVPLVSAYEMHSDIELTHAVLQGDHSFSWTRIELAQTVAEWLTNNCR